MDSKLFSPISLGGLVLPNRIVVSPMCQYSCIDGVLQPWHDQHLGHLALSGAGLLIIEATGVTKEGRITHGCAGLWNIRQERRLREVVERIRSYSPTAIGLQIGHTGRRAGIAPPWNGAMTPLAPETGAWRSYGPSALSHLPGWPVPRKLTVKGMARIAGAFAASAQRALRAGIDLIEVHGAHGYLLHQFLSPLANRRADEYGGSLRNRMRFPLEVAKAVRDVWPPERALGMRISGTDWHDNGWDLDQSVEFVRALGAVGYDYVCVSSGGIGGATALLRDHTALAQYIRQRTDVPICAVGYITDPAQAEATLADGKADLVALARAFLDNPRWGWHAALALGATPHFPQQYELVRPENWRAFGKVHPDLAPA
jgi:2,4-dienoyl-CoA reductase-like NADH-dependent reductase (Old Yellow Enzyme family)